LEWASDRNRSPSVCQLPATKGRIEGDFPDRAAVDFVGACEVALEHQLATVRNQHGMNIGIARGRESISHPAQRSAFDAPVLIDGGDGPAVVSHNRSAAAVGRVREHRQRGERCQGSSTEK